MTDAPSPPPAFPLSTFPPFVSETDLMLCCEVCEYTDVQPDTTAHRMQLEAAGDAHCDATGHGLTLAPLVEFLWVWTPTGETLNGYETALRLQAATAAQQ